MLMLLVPHNLVKGRELDIRLFHKFSQVTDKLPELVLFLDTVSNHELFSLLLKAFLEVSSPCLIIGLLSLKEHHDLLSIDLF